MDTIELPRKIKYDLPKITKKQIPNVWVKAQGIWPDKMDPIKYQRKLRKQYGN